MRTILPCPNCHHLLGFIATPPDLACPFCRSVIPAGKEPIPAGQKVRCAKCQGTFTAESPPPTFRVFASALELCPSCNAVLAIRTDLSPNARVRCPRCRKKFKPQRPGEVILPATAPAPPAPVAPPAKSPVSVADLDSILPVEAEPTADPITHAPRRPVTPNAAAGSKPSGKTYLASANGTSGSSITHLATGPTQEEEAQPDDDYDEEDARAEEPSATSEDEVDLSSENLGVGLNDLPENMPPPPPPAAPPAALTESPVRVAARHRPVIQEKSPKTPPANKQPPAEPMPLHRPLVHATAGPKAAVAEPPKTKKLAKTKKPEQPPETPRPVKPEPTPALRKAPDPRPAEKAAPYHKPAVAPAPQPTPFKPAAQPARKLTSTLNWELDIDWKKWAMYGLPVLLVVGLLYYFFIGGGPNVSLAEVEGVVEFDGKPLAGVQVEFAPVVSPGSRRLPFSKAITNDLGQFKLVCENRKFGAVIGTHKVVVRYPPKPRNPDGTPGTPPGPTIPQIYQTVADTPLEVEVKGDQTAYPIHLSQSPKSP